MNIHNHIYSSYQKSVNADIVRKILIKFQIEKLSQLFENDIIIQNRLLIIKIPAEKYYIVSLKSQFFLNSDNTSLSK